MTHKLDHGMGASKTNDTQVAEQLPRAALQARTAVGAAAAATTVPKVNLVAE